MTQITNDPEGYVKQQIKHHRKWKSRWSFLYFFFAATTIVAGAATTAVAGIFDGDKATLYTVLLAALTTILASLEKVLKLRDKWDLHRDIEHAYQILLFRAKELERAAFIESVQRINSHYSTELSGLTAATSPPPPPPPPPPSPPPAEGVDENIEGDT